MATLTKSKKPAATVASRATLRFLRISPRKVRLVLDTVRGLPYPEAVQQLKHSSRSAAKPLLKLLVSAAANAERASTTTSLKRDQLFVKSLTADEGPTLKRYQPRAFGRATVLRKRSSHIVLQLGAKPGEAMQTASASTKKPVTAASTATPTAAKPAKAAPVKKHS